jgi:hypothetical protein
MADDDVQLTDLEVIQQFSLAVRGATASRADVIAALEADLAYLGASRRPAPAKDPALAKASVADKVSAPPAASDPKPPVASATAPARAKAAPARARVTPAVKPSAKAPAKPATKKAPAKTARRA